MSRAHVVADTDYPRLKGHVIEATGLAYYREKDDDLVRHVASRLDALGLSNCGAYLAALCSPERGQQELDALVAQLTIGETYFFRHTEQFDALRLTVLPDILARNQNSRRLRIWSAGCAIGAEPYSIAALLHDFDHCTAGWDVCIVGTDINRKFLARAIEGRFEDWAFRGVPETFRQRHFRKAGKSWLISEALKSKVTFQYHNLVQHTFPSVTNGLWGFDLIVCRNVMIYFDAPGLAAVVARFRESLVEGGWLIVGHAESAPDRFQGFRVVNAHGASVYQRPLPGSLTEGPVAALAPQSAGPLPEPPLSPAVAVLPPPPTKPAGSGPVTVEPADPQPGIEAVRLLADRGHWQQAADACRNLLAQNGLDPLAHFYNALILEQSGAAAEARQELQRTIYLDRRFVLAHYHLGLLQQKERETAQAVRSFENVIELLAQQDNQRPFALADGMTVRELRELTHAHLEVLGSRA